MSEEMGQNDHDWLAFRYVAGEMTVEEAAEFECLLSENQPAREAVAAAVQLSQAVELAARNARPDRQEVVPAPRGRRVLTWRQRLIWASIGAAASLLVAWGLQSWRDASRPAPPAHEDLAGLAVQWRAAGDYDADDEDGPANDREPLESAADARPNAVHDLWDDLAAPDWLLAAVGEKNMPPMNGTDGD
jgi:ferric-dicitrate binding protein FerR (iron transport regulator)